MAPNIIIVDDDPVLLANLTEYLALDGFRVKGVGCALDFYAAISTDVYEAAVVDIGLPDRSGYEIISHLRENFDMGIITLTARGTLADKLKGYDAGADQYFVKPVDSREISAAVKNLLRRLEHPPDRAPSGFGGAWGFSRDRWCLVSPQGHEIRVSIKERAFLTRIINAKGEPVSRSDLFGPLGYFHDKDDLYATRAMDVMIARLRKKIAKSTSRQAPIKTIRGAGYCFTEPVHT